MRKFFKFIWLCIKTAFRHSRSIIDTYAFFVGLILALINYFEPVWVPEKWLIKMNSLFLIPIMIVTSILVLVRLLISPFWVYQERDEQANKKEAELNFKLKEQEKRLDEREKNKEISEQLGKYWIEAQQLMSVCKKQKEIIYPGDIDTWFYNTCAFIKENLGTVALAKFNNKSNPQQYTALGGDIKKPYIDFWNFLNIHSYNLNEIIDNLTKSF